MVNNRLYHLIEKSLEIYDNQNRAYDDYINNRDIEYKTSESEIIFIFKESNSSKIIKESFKYEILGIFDNDTFIWAWSWLIPYFKSRNTNISKELLQYGLKLEPSSSAIARDEDIDTVFLKVQFVNSRFLFEDNFQLDIHLALCSYLSKNKFKFILPRKIYKDRKKKKYIIILYNLSKDMY